MKTLALGLMISALLIGACTLPAMLTGAGRHTGSSTSTSSTSTVEEINGQPVEPDEEAPRKKKKPKVSEGEGFGATCNRNKDCDTNTCFVGKGDLGYCTKMCNSFSDCPTFWECKRAGNAPQKICMQDD